MSAVANLQKTDYSPAATNSVYTYVGQRIRERRKQLKLNQTQLAGMMGFSYQQMQKYESGASQISVSRLLQFARVLNVKPNYFYEGISVEEEIGQTIERITVQRNRTHPLSVLLIEDSLQDIIQFRNALELCSQPVDLNIVDSATYVMDYLMNSRLKYGKQRPDIILIEPLVAKSSGFSLVKSIRRVSQLCEIPIIALTNSINQKDLQELYQNGIAGFMQKPAELREYVQALDILLTYWSKAIILPRM